VSAVMAIAMAECLRHHGDVDAGGQAQRCGTVAQVVQPYAAQAGLVDELPEALGHVLRGQRGADEKRTAFLIAALYVATAAVSELESVRPGTDIVFELERAVYGMAGGA
jgi:hypothetical protein